VIEHLGQLDFLHGTLEAELCRLSFILPLDIDEVGYIPFDPEAASSCSPWSPNATNARR
jgi:hypothetical protein